MGFIFDGVYIHENELLEEDEILEVVGEEDDILEDEDQGDENNQS